MKKISKITLVIAMFLPFTIYSQQTVWLKHITLNPSKISLNHSVCTDNENNFYVMANFEDKILIGEDIILESAGKTDGFIAKIDPDGIKMLLGIQISSAGTVSANSLCTDMQNNLFVTGSFEGETTFGDITIKPKSKFGFFIAKYSSSGEIQWVKQGGNWNTTWPVSTANGIDLETDKAGNLYVVATVLGMYDDWKDDPTLPDTKRYLGKAYYEDQIIESDNFYTGNHNMIIKVSPDGDFIWKRVMDFLIGFADITVDENENIYGVGSIVNKTKLDGKEIESNGWSDIIAMKLDKEGKTAWIKQFGVGKPFSQCDPNMPEKDFEGGLMVDLDAKGNIYFIGKHFDGAKFGHLTMASQSSIAKIPSGNIFLAKLDTEGTIQWVINTEGKGNADMSGMDCDSEGNTYLTGRIFGKKMTFDGKTAKGPFFAKISPQGETLWIDDSESWKLTWDGNVKTDVTWPGGMALNKSEDFLYGTANALVKTVVVENIVGDSGHLLKTTTKQASLAIVKAKTGKK